MTELAPTTRSRVLAALRAQRIETASWAFGNSGTRFQVFAQAGVPREEDGPPKVVHAIREDPKLTGRQRQALIEVYEAFVGVGVRPRRR